MISPNMLFEVILPLFGMPIGHISYLWGISQTQKLSMSEATTQIDESQSRASG